MANELTPAQFTSMLRDAFRIVLKEHFPVAKPILNPEYITIKELCILLKVSKVTIHTWKKAGIIPFQKVCGKLLFDKQVILYKINAEPNIFGKKRDYSGI